MTQAADDNASRLPAGLRAALLPAQGGQALTFVLLPSVLPAIALFFGGGEPGTLVAQRAVTFPFLGLTIGGLVAGWVIRLAGLRGSILLAAALYALGGITGLVTGNANVLLAGCIVIGLGAAWLTAGLSAMTAIALDGEQRARMIGYQAATGNTFSFVFSFAAAVIAQQFGWRASFGCYALFGLFMLALTFATIPRTPPAASAAGPAPAGGGLIARAWPIFLAGGLLFMLGTTQSTVVPFLMEANGITSPALRGLTITIATGGAIVAALFYSAMQPRIGENAVIAAGVAAGTCGWLIFGFWTSGFAIACVASALLGFANGALLPVLFSAAMRAAPGEESGRAVGYLGSAIFLGSFANPLIVNPILAVTGQRDLMFVVAAALAAGGIASLLIRAAGRRRVAAG